MHIIYAVAAAFMHTMLRVAVGMRTVLLLPSSCTFYAAAAVIKGIHYCAADRRRHRAHYADAAVIMVYASW
jgi:predicted membrane protein